MSVCLPLVKLIFLFGMQGGMWVPGTCMVDAMKLTNALAKEARNMGKYYLLEFLKMCI
jgi:glycine/D-amino acid oxidase-like deaminating enzyme